MLLKRWREDEMRVRSSWKSWLNQETEKTIALQKKWKYNFKIVNKKEERRNENKNIGKNNNLRKMQRKK